MRGGCEEQCWGLAVAWGCSLAAMSRAHWGCKTEQSLQRSRLAGTGFPLGVCCCCQGCCVSARVRRGSGSTEEQDEGTRLLWLSWRTLLVFAQTSCAAELK